MRFGWRGLLGIVLSAALLWYAFSRVEDWSRVLDSVRHANIWLLLLSVVAATACFPLRARRWRPILAPVEPDIPFRPLWHATAIGMMINNVVPARAGELARAYALTRERPSVPFATSFASLAVDRLFDAVVVLGLMFLAMASPSFPSHAMAGNDTLSHAATGGLAFVVLVVIGMYVFVWFPERIIGLFELLARRVAPNIEERGRKVLRAFADGLGVLRHPARFLAVLWWAVLFWLLNALAFWLGFRAVGIEAPFSAALFLQAIIAIGVALPAVPGFFGVFEAAGQLGLGLYGVGPGLATAWAVTYHVLSFIPITVIGAVYFARTGLSLDEIASVGRRNGSGGDNDAAAPEPRPAERGANASDGERS